MLDIQKTVLACLDCYSGKPSPNLMSLFTYLLKGCYQRLMPLQAWWRSQGSNTVCWDQIMKVHKLSDQKSALFPEIYIIKEQFLRMLGYNESALSTLWLKTKLPLKLKPFAVWFFSNDIIVSVKKSKQISLLKGWCLMTIRQQTANGIDNSIHSLVHLGEEIQNNFWLVQWYHEVALSTLCIQATLTLDVPYSWSWVEELCHGIEDSSEPWLAW